MLFRSRKKNGREVSLYEPIGTDKEGNEISLLDILESSDGDIAEAMDFRKNLRRLYKIFDGTLTEREKRANTNLQKMLTHCSPLRFVKF